MQTSGEANEVSMEISGLVIPVAWGVGGEVTQVALAAFDESIYLVVPQGRGHDLLGHLQGEMAVKGAVFTQGGKKMIRVASFRNIARSKGSTSLKLALVAVGCLFIAGQLAPALAAEKTAPTAAESAVQAPAKSQAAKPMVKAKPVKPVKSKLVMNVQRGLVNQGYKVKPDGFMGHSTSKALRDFQQKKGLKVTGKIDKKTLAALGVK